VILNLLGVQINTLTSSWRPILWLIARQEPKKAQGPKMWGAVIKVIFAKFKPEVKGRWGNANKWDSANKKLADVRMALTYEVKVSSALLKHCIMYLSPQII
jgi:hypothetical protein